jgi:uncharacterized protein (DUF952 family)
MKKGEGLMRMIYHLVTPGLWRQNADRPYRAASLDTEGFIHCSNAAQVAWAANTFYAAEPELLVLHLDADRLASPLKDEPAAGQTFPHLYGPLNRDAVLREQPLTRGPDGRWVFAG